MAQYPGWHPAWLQIEQLAGEYLRELDPTPATAEWAASEKLPSGMLLRTWDQGGSTLSINNQIIQENPTVGQVRTACRLFRR